MEVYKGGKMNNVLLVVILLIIALICFFIFRPVLERLSFLEIIKDSFNAFRDGTSDKICKRSVFLFYIVPIVLGILFAIYVGITETQLNTILTIFSIFIGLLFNLLLLVIDVIQKSKEKLNSLIEDIKNDTNTDYSLKKVKLELRSKLSKEIFYSISFAILIAIIIVLVAFISTIKVPFIPIILKGILKVTAGSIIYSLVLIFVSSLFLILKRIHEVLKHDIKN